MEQCSDNHAVGFLKRAIDSFQVFHHSVCVIAEEVANETRGSRASLIKTEVASFRRWAACECVFTDIPPLLLKPRALAGLGAGPTTNFPSLFFSFFPPLLSFFAVTAFSAFYVLLCVFLLSSVFLPSPIRGHGSASHRDTFD